MKNTFSVYFPELLKHEGGYVDHPSDPGGATKFGITIGTLKAWRGKPVTKADVKRLTKAEAMEIYRANYWNKIGGDDLPAGVDAVALDIAVNHGVGRWAQWKPLIKGSNPREAVMALCERRRRFYRGLKTYTVFGKGWMRRAGEVEAWALLHIGKAFQPVTTRQEPIPANDEQPEAPAPVVVKNTPMTPKSRTAQGAGGATLGGAVIVATQTKDGAEMVRSASDSLGVSVLVLVGIIIAVCGAYALYARWTDGGGRWPWEKK